MPLLFYESAIRIGTCGLVAMTSAYTLKVASSILARCMSAARMWRCAFWELSVGCGSGAMCVAVSHTTTVALLGRNMGAGGAWRGLCLCAPLRGGGRVVGADA